MALLAHLHTHFREKPEDLATLSLQYIISQSPEINQAFTKFLGDSFHVTNIPPMNYICQRAGEQKERPDLSGIDKTGKEIVLCEAKFYAGLTENQPITYLHRLRLEHGLGLTFICPTARKKTLWAKLLSIVEIESPEYYVDIKGVSMSIITWAEVIEVLYRATSVSDEQLRSDISELDALCRMMDEESFIPFTPEDMGPEKARLEDRYYLVIDELFKELSSDKSLKPKTSKNHASSYRNGYSQAITVHLANASFSLTFYYDRKYWRDPASSETPFWLLITDSDGNQPESFRESFIRKAPLRDIITSYGGKKYLALHVPQYESLDVVAKEMKAQIIRYIDGLQAAVGNNTAT